MRHLERAAHADIQERESVIQKLASQPDKTLETAVDILNGPKKRLWKIAVQVIRSIGYPRNAPAIPTLFDQVGDRNSPAWREVVETLVDMGSRVVAPYMIYALLEKQSYWIDTITGICTMLTLVEINYARLCGPAVSYLLSQGKLSDKFEELEQDYLLDVLEKLGPECAFYALPVLIQLVKKEGAGELSKQARKLIASFKQEDLEPYQFLIADSLQTE